MLGAQRAAVVASRALRAQRIAAAPDPAALALRLQQEGDPDSLSWRDALWLATVGGARALGLVRGRTALAPPCGRPLALPSTPGPSRAHAGAGPKPHLCRPALLAARLPPVQDRVGTLAPGQQFDALLVDGGCGAAYDLFPQSSPLEQVEKFLCCGDDRHIVQVWVQGRPIKHPGQPPAP